jgi:hypothetical protein
MEQFEQQRHRGVVFFLLFFILNLLAINIALSLPFDMVGISYFGFSFRYDISKDFKKSSCLIFA